MKRIEATILILLILSIMLLAVGIVKSNDTASIVGFLFQCTALILTHCGRVDE